MTALPDDELGLAADFPDASREQWQRLVEGVLRKTGKEDVHGKDAEDALATRLEDGLTVQPLYTAEDGSGPVGVPGFGSFLRGSRPEGNTVESWDVRQRHAQPDPKLANEAILADLENGVTSVWLTVGPGGVPVSGLATALDGVYLDLAPVVLDTDGDAGEAARALLALYADRGVPKEAALGSLGADPVGRVARTGSEDGLDRRLAETRELAALCAREYPKVRTVTVDALPYHEAGGSAAQELGCSLATGVAYLRELTEAGLSVESALAQLEFRYAASADQFLTIAKFRAARRLWARVAEVSGAPAGTGAQHQHAVTSPVMMTRRDPWVNMLRTTVACLGAGVGGANAVTVLPFDSALGLPDAFARRIARNTSSILIEESHLARVVDPAGGSWYVEQLTEELARAAWAWFQEIERAGGQLAALRSGLVAERLAATWQERSAKLAKRREPVTGVSEFPHLDEQPVEREPAPAPLGGGLPRVRRDEAFEALRARSDAHLAATGARPRVFLAALGSAAAHTARASFASNFFRTAGIEPVHEPVTVDAASAAAAYTASGATIACLCSSDTLYAEQAEAVAKELKSAGARRVFLAGRPGEARTAYERAGVDEFVFVGSDVVAVLSSVLDQMGVA
ncbi:methylmalonyl-CoA mutase small subunit [Streptomyces sp. NA04227]|uniref:methylmalonyl-CoA mutase small subunit n=1 Tax=Streptomyces sp. NA04227 TaxID=2742136 RepID=UPI001591DE7A|nr:methylmalonyl-CoA mutase small subunit [Streptomyces sp. NA04227]QKW10010.1 methylmalonyl-CoA mutase small subunit [Streptomyces sp. NA04227]